MSFLSQGSVRARFEESQKPEHEERRFLARAMAEVQTPGHFMTLADRLAELAPNMTTKEEAALRLVTIALLGAIQQGGTGLRLRADEEERRDLRDQLDALLGRARQLVKEAIEANAERPPEERRLIPDGLFDASRVDALIEDFQKLRRDGDKLDKVIGQVGEATPIVEEEGVLYTHRTAQLVDDVAKALAALMERRSPVDTSSDDVEGAIEEVLDHMPFSLGASEKEEAAARVRALLPANLGMITGGAGSGKTTMVLMVLRVMMALDGDNGGLEPGDIALAAPTGKAAKRLGESIDEQIGELKERFGDLEEFEALDELPEPKTLHRLLKYSPFLGRFRRDADNPLDARLVVVDEASMMGLEMVQALVDALPEGARLLLVGDAGQLPSVEAGAVFEDLTSVDDNHDPLGRFVIKLTENHRVHTGDKEAARIVDISKEIRRGRAGLDMLESDGQVVLEASLPEEGDHPSGVYFCDTVAMSEEGAGQDGNGSAIEEIVDNWVARHFQKLWPQRSREQHLDGHSTHWYRRQPGPFIHDERGRFDGDVAPRIEEIFQTYEACQTLTITRVGRRGSNAINRLMHRQYLESHGLIYPGYPSFEPGEPVLITQNDYDEGVFNGQQGIILYTSHGREGEEAKKRLVVRDGEGFRVVSFKRMRDKLEHAYALTVHKSQGSEYDHISVILPRRLDDPEDDSELRIHPLLTREILYTAVTRAKKSVCLYGDPKVFDASVQATVDRHCGLRERMV